MTAGLLSPCIVVYVSSGVLCACVFYADVIAKGLFTAAGVCVCVCAMQKGPLLCRRVHCYDVP